MGETYLYIFFLTVCACLFRCAIDDGDNDRSSTRSDTPSVYSQYRLEPSHQGISPPGTSLGPDLEMVWKSAPLAIGDYRASKSSPAVDSAMIYIGVDDGQLYALDRSNGAVVWRFKTHRYAVESEPEATEHYGIHGSPAFDRDCVYVGDYSGYLYAIYKDSGRLKWEKKLGGSIGASPVLFGGKIFISVEYPAPDGKIFVLDASDGSQHYSTPYLGHHMHASVSIDKSRRYLFVGANNGVFYCFDFHNNKEVWRYQAGGEIKSTAAVVDDTVYFTAWDHHLHAIEIETGEEKYAVPTQDSSMSSPSYYRGNIYFGSDDNFLYSIDAKSGRLRWKYQTGGIVLSSPTVVQQSGVVIVGSRDESVYMLTLDEGELQWSARLASEVSSVPVAVGNALYVNDDSGTVWSFVAP